jgi:hypothetical protein
MSSTTQNTNNNIDIILWGAASVGEALGLNKQKAFRLLDSGSLDAAGAKKLNGRWCVSRRRLMQFIEA